jgi:hypothetical protein
MLSDNRPDKEDHARDAFNVLNRLETVTDPNLGNTTYTYDDIRWQTAIQPCHGRKF